MREDVIQLLVLADGGDSGRPAVDGIPLARRDAARFYSASPGEVAAAITHLRRDVCLVGADLVWSRESDVAANAIYRRLVALEGRLIYGQLRR
jgi:hypothetical protein